jgi:hypothetical protein|tara:strand:- start:1779 stop:2282 length:504 start_codon:yes stop_codon:yes gene_type:complete
MHKIGSIIKQINRRNKMELETFECSYKVAYPSRDGGGKYSIYVTKDDGTDMTIYGEAIGAEGWAKGAKLRIKAEPARESKNGKWYQTAKSVELLDKNAVKSNTYSAIQPVTKDPASQWKEKYRLTMSNLLASWLSSGKELTPEVHKNIDLIVRDILDAKYDGDNPPF